MFALSDAVLPPSKKALVALGSNLGDRAAKLDAAVASLQGLPLTRLLAKSSWVESAPLGPAAQPDYLNGVVLIETGLEPLDLLDHLQTVENAAGRVRAVRWGARTLDLDLLLYDDLVCDGERLTLPHPRMALRRFVLEPAAQIAAAVVHPTTRMTIGDLLARYRSTPAYVAIMGPPGCGKTRLAGEVARRSGCLLLLDAGEPPAKEGAGGPANSASPALRREIEFLARRSRLLAADAPPAGRGMVSDFWLGQALAWSEAEQPGEGASRVEAAYRQLEPRAVSARCLAVLDVGSRQTQGASGDDLASSDDFDERLRAAMRSLAKRPGQPPAVWLASDDWEGAIAELTAALAG